MSRKIQEIQWLILDVDGTMTDGGVYIDNKGVESKKFSIKDGAGILLAAQARIKVVILTGRESVCVSKRAEELRIPYVFQNVKNKRRFLEGFFKEAGVEGKTAAYMGDDYNDLSAMAICGVSACPKDAAEKVRENCDFVLKTPGGQGAVREFVEILLKEKGILELCREQLWG